MGSGEFYYFGLIDTLQKYTKKLLELEITVDNIDCDFNVDGLPIQKSTRKSFWPILCRINNNNFKEYVFPVAIFCGTSKPPLHNYLTEFVKELSNILRVGFVIDGKYINVTVRSFCCDMPARCFIKNVKGHNAYYGCDKCIAKGEMINKRMTYLELSAPLRTDGHFDKKLNEQYHKGDTPLSELKVGLITSFPVDYMHCICLGVMRKLLFLWRDGSRIYRISGDNRVALDNNLNLMQNCWPLEFNRKPRTLIDLERWKATELRQFLLYLGPVLLMNVLPKRFYCHFLLLNFAIAILLNINLNKHYNQYANELLKQFELVKWLHFIRYSCVRWHKFVSFLLLIAYCL
ncbi:hypothetical protein RI129_002761 [Pyrocoelia pectoralis]|uniref:Transposase domain-containing protein n=1 Tax=Pyrocoelia pectoralis TaxID=417401 RepID=A0AAN7VQ88_9COLE